MSLSDAAGVAAAVPWAVAVLWYFCVTLRDRAPPVRDAAAGHEAWLILRRAELVEAEQSAGRACEAAERAALLAVTADAGAIPGMLDDVMESADRAAAAATAAAICARQIARDGTSPIAAAFADRAAAALSRVATAISLGDAPKS